MTKTPFKSFDDIPRDALMKVTVPPEKKLWIKWEPQDLAQDILAGATQTLNQWLEARIADLIREKVDFEDVQVVHHGSRTAIRVAGRDRFEFKMKITMGGS